MVPVQPSPGQAHGFENRRCLGEQPIQIERGNTLGCTDRVKQWAFAFGETQALAKCPRHDQNIGKQDGGIHTVAADGLQCNLSGQIRCRTKRDEIARLGACSTVLGQISPGLTHQPYGGWPDGLSGQGAQKGFGPAGLVFRFHDQDLSIESKILKDVVACRACGLWGGK